MEDQLLAKVVELERPDLEEKARALTAAAINYQIQLVELEDELLERLANAPDDILSDVPLIEGLEATKKTAQEINEAVETGKSRKRKPGKHVKLIGRKRRKERCFTSSSQNSVSLTTCINTRSTAS